GTAAGACAPAEAVKSPNAARQKITICTPTAVFAECMACLPGGTLLWRHERFEVVLGWRGGSGYPLSASRWGDAAPAARSHHTACGAERPITLVNNRKHLDFDETIRMGQTTDLHGRTGRERSEILHPHVDMAEELVDVRDIGCRLHDVV